MVANCFRCVFAITNDRSLDTDYREDSGTIVATIGNHVMCEGIVEVQFKVDMPVTN